MALTVQTLAVGMRLATNPSATVAEPLNGLLTRWLTVGNEHAERYAPDAPEALKESAVILYCLYIYAQPDANRAQSFGYAWLNSGAAAILSPWRERRLAVAAED